MFTGVWECVGVSVGVVMAVWVCVGVWVWVGVVTAVWVCVGVSVCVHGCERVCRRVCSTDGSVTSDHRGCACLSWSSANTAWRHPAFSGGRTSVHGLGREPQPVCGPAAAAMTGGGGSGRAREGMGLATFSTLVLSCDSCYIQNCEQ